MLAIQELFLAQSEDKAVLLSQKIISRAMIKKNKES